MNQKTRRLNKENNMLDAQISEENQGVFTDMICYLRGSNLSEYNIEVIRHDLAEMVLAAQKRGENINSVIGGNYKEFCDDVIGSLPQKTIKEQLLEGVDIICLSFSILIVIKVLISKELVTFLQSLTSEKIFDYNITFSVGNVVSMMAIIVMATIIVGRVTKNALKTERKHEKVFIFGMSAALMLMFILIGWLANGATFTVNFFAPCILAIVLFVSHRVLNELC